MNLAALGSVQEASPYFFKAHNEPSKDVWFVENERERLAQLKVRAGEP